ncbi:ribose-phosphate pyrophosphokinase [candidate division NPL-UPA2 bacterium Unc8]|uniref:Ribose-phosphate pyrophosphokinase n=1 Tax=candidate division NPL-UPA2 bacterium Unc8 TaxID=1980939 RepID=A0A399FZX4_UNCN2|nr:MAG: ribose-phosphate pyrophosphokinase [candidate division NPL-UPA2 bacterium Unc8]
MIAGSLRLFSGNSNRPLAEGIARYLKTSLMKAEVGTFLDKEIRVEIEENIRGTDVFIIQSTCPPVNDNLMELLIMIDALRRASARRVTAVIPYYGYARQDRKVRPRVPITAKLIANLITTAGVHRVLVMDLHAGQIQGFFDIPVDHLFAAPTLISYFKKKKIEDMVVVAPDPGAVERAAAFAKRLEAPLAIVDKRRLEAGVAKVFNVIGSVRKKNAVLVDDMIDTGGSVLESARILNERGAKNIYVSCTHPVFSGSAVEELRKSPIQEVVVTNTIPFAASGDCDKIKVLSVAKLLGEAIKRIHKETSVSSLFV